MTGAVHTIVYSACGRCMCAGMCVCVWCVALYNGVASPVSPWKRRVSRTKGWECLAGEGIVKQTAPAHASLPMCSHAT